MLKYPDTDLMNLYSIKKCKKTFHQLLIIDIWRQIILAIVITMHIKEIRLETILCELTKLLTV